MTKIIIKKGGPVINFYEQIAFTTKIIKCVHDIIGRKIILRRQDFHFTLMFVREQTYDKILFLIFQKFLPSSYVF